MTRTILASSTVLVALLLMSLSTSAPAAAPEPNIVPSSWELDFKHNKPRVISVRVPGEDGLQHFWYMTYTVTNVTGEDQYFVPEFTLVTDAGDILQGNRQIPPQVVKAIQNRENNPLLERPTDTIGRLLQGRDNARDGMAIWRMPDHNVRHVRIFIAGLSGEIHTIEDPETGEEITLRKTLMLEYELPGSGEHMRRKEFRNEETDWVVR